MLLLENPLDRQQDNLAELRLMYFQKLIVIVNLVENRRNKDKVLSSSLQNDLLHERHNRGWLKLLDETNGWFLIVMSIVLFSIW